MDYSANSSGTLHNLIFILEYNFYFDFRVRVFYQRLIFGNDLFYECGMQARLVGRRPLSFRQYSTR